MIERRRQLGGFLPKRTVNTKPLNLPKPDLYAEFFKATPVKQEVSTTMAFVRLLRKLLDDPQIGKRIVPIIPDEARTFGMDFLFKKVGIYAALGQLYEPVDSDMLLSYNESKDGQILEEGITEAGSVASFTAAGTAYATHGEAMIPFYMFYSMFGFQRTGDGIWAFADQRGRGFLIGGTAGRTTLSGEGLQHCDGHTPVLASTVPNAAVYDPAFHYETAIIVKDGLRRMFDNFEDVFYYITAYNENYAMPSMPQGVEEGILKGIYLFRNGSEQHSTKVQLFGSGSILLEVIRAQELLEKYGVSADVWSVTSYQQLRKDALETEQRNFDKLNGELEKPYITRVMEGRSGPFIAASDYMKMNSDQISRWLPGRFAPLGTDGFGLSDTRKNMRHHFRVSAEWVVAKTLYELATDGKVEFAKAAAAKAELGLVEQEQSQQTTAQGD
jgi:pyruvate dehydrogenase E1 component